DDAVIFRSLESQRFCWRCCRSCRHVFGWFDCDVAQLTVRAEIGSAATPSQRLLPLCRRAVGGLSRIPAKSAVELDKRRILTFARFFRQLGPVHTHHTRWPAPGPARARLRGQGTHQKSKNTKTLKR